nr:hypothetical protein [Tanacetum cinerariifolium]
FYEEKGIKREYSVARTPQQNRVAERKNRTLIEATRAMALVTKPQNKSPYELIHGRPPLVDFMKPFGCHVTILNTRDNLGKFDRKADEGYFIGYYVVSKAMRAFNKRNRIVEKTLNIRFLKNAPNVKGNGPDWFNDIDSLTVSMNYVPVITGNQTNGIARTRDNLVVDLKNSTANSEKKDTEVDESGVLDNGGQDDQVTRSDSPASTDGPSFVNAASPSPINGAATPASTNAFEEHPFKRLSTFKNAFSLPRVPTVTQINDTGIFGNAYDDEVVEEEVDMNNVASSYTIPDAPFTKFLKYHPQEQVIGSIGTKWVLRNKKDKRGIVVKSKARLFTQRHTQEEGIAYDEVFAPVARIEPIRLFMAYASFKDFVVYQMDVKSAFLYGKIKEEVYVCQAPGFEDSYFPDKVYKTDSTLMEPNNPLIKDEEAEDVDVHLYRLMIGLLMYLTASRPDITFAIYLKGQLNLGLWYPKDLPFDLEAFYDSNYAGAILDKKSTTGGCQFLCKRLISWQYKKQTIVSNSTTEAEYVAAANCCGQAPRNHIRGADSQTRFETASKKSRDPPLPEVNTSGSGEDGMEHPDDLTDFVPPTPHDSPLSGGHTPGSDEGKDASKQGRNNDKTEELNLTDGADTEVIVEDKGSGKKGGSTADQVSTARPEVSTASVFMNHAQPKDMNELFQKLLEDLQIINKELAEYINSLSWNHHTFFNDNKEHSVQYKKYLENYSNSIVASNFNQEKENPQQDSDIRQLVREECGIEVCEKQKQNMEDTLLELLEYGYEHLSTIPETKSDEVIKSSVKNLLPIPSEYEVTSDDESERDVLVKDESSLVFTIFSNPLFDDDDDFTSSDDESLSDEDVPTEDFKVYSNPLFDDKEINSNKIDLYFVESLSNRDTLIDSSPKFDYLKEFSGALMPPSIADEERIRREHKEYISLMEKLLAINPCPRPLENFHGNTIIKTLPTSPIPVEDSDSQREEIDIFTGMNELLPPSIESDDYDSEGEIHVFEELLVDNSIPLSKNESSNFDHHDDPLFPRPPPEPPDVEFFFDLEPNSGDVISAVINNIDELNEDECFDSRGEIDVFANDDYFSFIFFIRIFLPYLIYPEVSPLLLSAGSEDTIFDPGISV